jgi:DNA-binding response OmpR family regulator
MRILIITSDNYTGKTLINQLADRHYDVECAERGTKAISLLRRHSFDVAIVDTFLPDIEGVNLINILKTDYPDLKIIAMSNHNSREIEMAVRKQGVLYYMLKSSDIQHLTIILNHLEKKCPKFQAGFNDSAHYHPYN